VLCADLARTLYEQNVSRNRDLQYRFGSEPKTWLRSPIPEFGPDTASFLSGSCSLGDKSSAIGARGAGHNQLSSQFFEDSDWAVIRIAMSRLRLPRSLLSAAEPAVSPEPTGALALVSDAAVFARAAVFDDPARDQLLLSI
jgi:hypothetical protein